MNEQCMKPPEPDKTQDVPASTSPVYSACHAEHRPEAQPTCSTGDFEPGRQGRESLDSIDPSATGRADAPSVPVRTPLGNHHREGLTMYKGQLSTQGTTSGLGDVACRKALVSRLWERVSMVHAQRLGEPLSFAGLRKYVACAHTPRA